MRLGGGQPWLRCALVVLGIGVALPVGCGGSVEGDGTGKGGRDGGSGSGGVSVGGKGGIGGFVTTGGTGGKKDGGPDAKTGGSGGMGGFVDPGCPDAAPPEPIEDCDPFGPNTCPQGEACYPFVQYPSGPCDHELFGAVCAPTGTGTQGEPCGALECAAKHVCVITGQGTECVELCQLFGPDTCPNGLFCVPIDVEGIGGCY